MSIEMKAQPRPPRQLFWELTDIIYERNVNSNRTQVRGN